MSYDPKCYKLAAAFLEDHPDKNTEENRTRLAQQIQTSLEKEIYYLPKCKPFPEGKICGDRDP